MGWIESKSFGFLRPDFADELVGSKALRGLEPLGEIVSGDEVAEVSLQLVVAVVVVALDGRFLEDPIHTFDLAVGLGVVGLGQPVFDAVTMADPVKRMSAKAGGWAFAVLGKIGELDAVVGEHGVDAVGDG